MIKLPNQATIFVDCDSTLVSWSIPEDFNMEDTVIIECNEQEKACVIYKHNVELLISFSCTNHAVVIWSGSGADWAYAVCKALKLDKYVSVCMGKPNFYVDDKECSEFMGKRIYYNLDGELSENLYKNEPNIT